jgi:hypothetical protein
MSTIELTKTQMRQGVWQGVITQSGGQEPLIEVSHRNTLVTDFTLTHEEKQDHWVLAIPVPAEMIADGVHTLVIKDKMTGQQIGHETFLAGDVLGDDIRAEMDLLRAELDMLKRAFRRHCRETE